MSYKEPCLVNAGQGFSVLYNNKLLFSKYAPQRALTQMIEGLEIRAGTLFLLCSPILQFPIILLQQRLLKCTSEIQKSCCILAVEHDKALYKFSQNHIKLTPNKTRTQVAYLYTNTSQSAATYIHNAQLQEVFPKQGELKRIVKIDCSAATQLQTSFYAELLQYADTVITTFWKNRMTITHLGKLFSTNMLKNVALLEKSTPLVAHSIAMPILLCGAGCSLDDIADELVLSFTSKTQSLARKSMYIIAVDVTTIPLLSRGIIPDAIISMESQLAIEQSYVGMHDLIGKCKQNATFPGNPKQIRYICDITSRNAVARTFCNHTSLISFFMSQYCDEPFMERIQAIGLVSPLIQPLGSVGLAAVKIAKYLRVQENSIFICGLDFSFPAGLSHCKGAPAPQRIFRTLTRTQPPGSPIAAYKKGAQKLDDTYFTDIALFSYGRLFVEHFASTKNIFNLASTGFPLKIPFATFSDIKNTDSEYETNHMISVVPNANKIVQKFYADEKERLALIKDMLTEKTSCNTDTVLTLINECSYLYFHFPDGYKKARQEQDFLNRVRAEIDYYLKICK